MNYSLIILWSALFMGATVSQPAIAQQHDTLQWSWSVAGELPAVNSEKVNPGVAGSFAGLVHNNLLIAGGANFPDKLPWLGGKKTYCKDVYIFSVQKNHWQYKNVYQFANAKAYGASVQTSKGLLCIGGENEQGISNEVFLLNYDEQHKRIAEQPLPVLPIPLTCSAAAILDNKVYVAGGETNGAVSDKIFILDMHHLDKGWAAYANLPQPVSHTVLIVQHNALYIIGGRKKNSDGISELYDVVWRYNMGEGNWTAMQPLPYSLSAATAVARGEDKILLFGGDKGATFHATELLIASINTEINPAKKDSLNEQKIHLQSTHPGFSNEILQYSISRNEWTDAGVIPYETPVTTKAVMYGNEILIPSGEIKAGVRTPRILSGKIISQKK